MVLLFYLSVLWGDQCEQRIMFCMRGKNQQGSAGTPLSFVKVGKASQNSILSLWGEEKVPAWPGGWHRTLWAPHKCLFPFPWATSDLCSAGTSPELLPGLGAAQATSGWLRNGKW